MWNFKVETHWEGKPSIEARAGKHKFVLDEPESGGGTDLGPNQLQYLLASLGGCFTAMGRLVAKEMGLKLDSIDTKVEADLDPAGLLGKDPKVRPGFQEIRLQVQVKTGEPADKMATWLETTKKRCPVEDILAHPTPIKVTKV